MGYGVQERGQRRDLTGPNSGRPRLRAACFFFFSFFATCFVQVPTFHSPPFSKTLPPRSEEEEQAFVRTAGPAGPEDGQYLPLKRVGFTKKSSRALTNRSRRALRSAGTQRHILTREAGGTARPYAAQRRRPALRARACAMLAEGCVTRRPHVQRSQSFAGKT